MPCSPEELQQVKRFEAAYERVGSPVMIAIERRVCGCDFGGNSWTGRAEADRMAAAVGLSPGKRLLDLGSGSGWPGLYMAETTGCDAVLVDLPLNGIRTASERAERDGVGARVAAAVADAAALPFADDAFDAVSHSDLLCCLREKRAVLAECRRVVRSEGLMAFTVISVAPDLSPDQYRRSVENGPEFVEADSGYPTMLDRTGWRILDRSDITAEFADRCTSQLRADEDHRDDLAVLLGDDAYSQRVAGWRSKIPAIRGGLLRRELFVVAPVSSA